MLVRKIIATGTNLQLFLRSFIRESKRLIYSMEEPFYRTGNPMAFAIALGVCLGTLIFVMLKNQVR
ncbi:hypothetical protein I5907_18450 [Panacibacter sp. DH6]|uniref:Uncharacterized protein n=1 Tax=Panacibacter microcysteis TaxID=2793269 RepID=A0A931GZH3_9BACT|nr:hypothetical protein [Panacibacter microcysteis]MBG9378226.1 hypothetical protein [Panacibacter microcysteis]